MKTTKQNADCLNLKLLCRFEAVHHSRVPAASLCFPTLASDTACTGRPVPFRVTVLAVKSKSCCFISEVLKRGLECLAALEVLVMALL